jgi:putative ABC transport system permease protein
MVFSDLVRDTLRTLAQHRLRTFLTMFGIAWGIVSITLMVAAGEGLRVGQLKVAENFGKDVMIVFAGQTSLQAGGMRAGRRLQWSATDHLAVQPQAPDCAYVMPELGTNVPVRSAYNSGSLLVTASLPDFAWIRSIGVAEGRYPNWDDERQARRVAFLGSDAKKQLFASRPALGQTIRIGDFPYTVVGTMPHKEQDSSYDGRDISKVFVPFSSALRDVPNKPPSRPDSVDRLLVAPKSIDVHEQCKDEVRRALGRLYTFDPRDKEAAHIWDTAEEAKAFQRMTDGMKYFLGAIGIATLFIGGIGVMNVMLVAVRERTREIGVRKALGATRGSILRQFFLETMMVVGLAGGTGLAIAYGLCALVNLLPMPQYFAGLLPTWSSALLAFGLLGSVALGAAMYPARRAASVDPIEALRFEAGG